MSGCENWDGQKTYQMVQVPGPPLHARAGGLLPLCALSARAHARRVAPERACHAVARLLSSLCRLRPCLLPGRGAAVAPGFALLSGAACEPAWDFAGGAAIPCDLPVAGATAVLCVPGAGGLAPCCFPPALGGTAWCLAAPGAGACAWCSTDVAFAAPCTALFTAAVTAALTAALTAAFASVPFLGMTAAAFEAGPTARAGLRASPAAPAGPWAAAAGFDAAAGAGTGAFASEPTVASLYTLLNGCLSALTTPIASRLGTGAGPRAAGGGAATVLVLPIARFVGAPARMQGTILKWYAPCVPMATSLDGSGALCLQSCILGA